jgi:hypothetical protein
MVPNTASPSGDTNGDQIATQWAMMHRVQNALERIFGCWHGNVSRALTISGRTYEVCLDCGKQFHRRTGHRVLPPRTTRNRSWKLRKHLEIWRYGQGRLARPSPMRFRVKVISRCISQFPLRRIDMPCVGRHLRAIAMRERSSVSAHALAISLTLPDVNFPNVTRLAFQLPGQPGPSPALAL